MIYSVRNQKIIFLDEDTLNKIMIPGVEDLIVIMRHAIKYAQNSGNDFGVQDWAYLNHLFSESTANKTKQFIADLLIDIHTANWEPELLSVDYDNYYQAFDALVTNDNLRSKLLTCKSLFSHSYHGLFSEKVYNLSDVINVSMVLNMYKQNN